MQSIRIFGKPYRVERVEKYDDPKQEGSIDTFTGLITVLDRLGDHAAREIILHETIHAIDEELALGFSEEQVQRLSVALYSVYRENGMHLVERPGGAE